MKYCPNCNERYDEEIIKFCTKDGTPLIEEEQPSFTAIPSETRDEEDVFGEETIIRRKGVDTPNDVSNASPRQSERFVVPTEPSPEYQQTRPRASTAYYPPPPPPNTGKTIALTILGTLVVLGFGAGLFWLLQKDSATNININTNPPNMNANLNTNLGFDSNFNFNTNANFNSNFDIGSNFNLNTNTRTPLPSPSPTVRITPPPSPSPTPQTGITPAASPTIRPPANRPPTSPTPRIGPRPPIMTSNRPPPGNN